MMKIFSKLRLRRLVSVLFTGLLAAGSTSTSWALCAEALTTHSLGVLSSQVAKVYLSQSHVKLNSELAIAMAQGTGQPQWLGPSTPSATDGPGVRPGLFEFRFVDPVTAWNDTVHALVQVGVELGRREAFYTEEVERFATAATTMLDVKNLTQEKVSALFTQFQKTRQHFLASENWTARVPPATDAPLRGVQSVVISHGVFTVLPSNFLDWPKNGVPPYRAELALLLSAFLNATFSFSRHSSESLQQDFHEWLLLSTGAALSVAAKAGRSFVANDFRDGGAISRSVTEIARLFQVGANDPNHDKNVELREHIVELASWVDRQRRGRDLGYALAP
jgi:hypothetical protein